MTNNSENKIGSILLRSVEDGNEVEISIFTNSSLKYEEVILELPDGKRYVTDIFSLLSSVN